MLPVLLIFVVILFALSIWLFLMYRQAKDIRLVETDLYLKDWPAGFEGIRILFVSDLHREVVPEKIKAELKKKTIDLVLFGGDLVVKDDSFDRVLEEIRFMASLAPSYFVWGNHDYEADYRHFDQLLRSNGIGVLDNRAVLFEVGEDNVWLIGVDDATKGRDDLEFALGDIDQPGFRLLLCHNPTIIKRLEKQHQIGLVLCGHTHGGQVVLPWIGPITGINSFFKTYCSGQYQLLDGETTLFIGNGVGTSHAPLRWGAKPAVYVLTLRKRMD